MKEFNEHAFVWALTARVEDARQFAMYFRPEYLRTKPLGKVLEVLFDFVKENSIPPSTRTIRELLEAEVGPEVFQARYSQDIARVEAEDPDISYQVHTLDMAKQVAMTRSFEDMVSSQQFIKYMTDSEGTELIKSVEKWQRYFAEREDGVHLNIIDAIEKLKETREFIPSTTQIPCGIMAVDKWLGGGLRTKNMGLWMAPTGHGKSAIMIYTSHYMAVMEEKKVWFITNELAWDEVTERFLARFSGKNVQEIMEDPIVGICSDGANFIRSAGLGENLYISDVPSGITTDDLEVHLSRFANLYGWSPDVIVLDYMERLRPVMKGINRGDTWVWFGEVARDLVGLAKRRNVAVWSAIQTNRPGLSASELKSEHAQGSIQHLQEVTAVISAHLLEETGDEQILEFKPLKMRQSRLLPRPIQLVCNLGTMTITSKLYEGGDEVDRSTPPATVRSKKGKVPFKPTAI